MILLKKKKTGGQAEEPRTWDWWNDQYEYAAYYAEKKQEAAETRSALLDAQFKMEADHILDMIKKNRQALLGTFRSALEERHKRNALDSLMSSTRITVNFTGTRITYLV